MWFNKPFSYWKNLGGYNEPVKSKWNRALRDPMYFFPFVIVCTFTIAQCAS